MVEPTGPSYIYRTKEQSPEVAGIPTLGSYFMRVKDEQSGADEIIVKFKQTLLCPANSFSNIS